MSELRSRRHRIGTVVSVAFGLLIALLGLALVIGHLTLNANEDRWLEALIEFMGIFAIGLSIVVGSIRDTKAIRWALVANICLWFALYTIVSATRDFIGGEQPSIHMTLYIIGMTAGTAIFGFLSYRSKARNGSSG
jgi:hypothetical protein